MSMINYGNNENKRGDINFKYERELNIQKGCTYSDIELHKLKNENKELTIFSSLLKKANNASNKKINVLTNNCINFHYDKINDTNIINNQANVINNQNIKIENLTTVVNGMHACYYKQNEDNKSYDNYIELDSNDYTIK